MNTFKLFNATDKGGKPFLGARVGDDHYNLSNLADQGGISIQLGPTHAVAARSTDTLMASGRLPAADECQQIAGDLKKADALETGAWRFQTPVMRPGKIIAVARNYAKHAEELGNAIPEEMAWFFKAPSTMTAHGDDVDVPEWLEGEVHHEAELAVIVGDWLANAGESTAMNAVAGYTIVNDLTAREVQNQAKAKGMPWAAGKNLGGFCPIGPYFVPAHQIADPHDLRIQCRVAGETKQDGNTGGMLIRIPQMLAHLSKWLHLEPGDIVSTGTPAGVGPIVIGESVECEIDGLALLQSFIGTRR